ncbi:MAG: rRNA maturation RNase YbeY [Candidatus Paceibacterota bacterium]
MNKVEIVSLSGKSDKKIEKELEKTGLKIIKFLGKNNVSIEVFLTEGRLMKFLNKKFRGKNKAADVLSFEEPKGFVSPKSKNKNIGEIYINSAKSYNLERKKFLLVHGILHLFGYDHQKKSDIIKMEKMENLCLSQL